MDLQAVAVDPYADIAAIIDGLDDHRRYVLLLRLAAKLNNGREHFDHGTPGYSWLCHRCALEGKGGLNGWVGALSVLAAAGQPSLFDHPSDSPADVDTGGKT